VLEADDTVGGISRTVEREGWRFDIGGHRFFTKVAEVEKLWKEILGARRLPPSPPPQPHLLPRQVLRLPAQGRQRPAQPGHHRGGAMRRSRTGGCGSVPPPTSRTFEGWVSARFGRRLYRIFFKTYTEKVWGVHPSKLPGRLGRAAHQEPLAVPAVLDSVPKRPPRDRRDVASSRSSTTPSRARDDVGALPPTTWPRRGAPVLHVNVGWPHPPPRRQRRRGRQPRSRRRTGARRPGRVISSMPFGELLLAMDPPPPPEVQDAADGPCATATSSPWPWWSPSGPPSPTTGSTSTPPRCRSAGCRTSVRGPRTWSRSGRTCLGLEYFVLRRRRLWTMDDDDLVELGRKELAILGLVRSRPT
jgi:hypothetical protein